MSSLEIFIMAWALSMDAFAVALAMGIQLCVVSPMQVGRLALSFGFFQFFMPVLGWYLGSHVRSYIEQWDHWLAFGLLSFIGIKMIREALQGSADDTSDTCKDPTLGTSLLMLSIATSIDALAVGLSIAFLGYSVWVPALCIGIICAILTTIGLRLGCFASNCSRIGSRAAIVGGIVLVGIGVNILYEHGVFQ